MKTKLAALTSAAAVALAMMAAAPAFSQTDYAQVRAEITQELSMISFEIPGGVESLTDDQAVQLKQILDDCECDAAEKKAAIETFLAQ
jgi:formiminotetrahydrofolate cyclodeaminase